jgi:uncharacterized protein with HEPN domain
MVMIAILKSEIAICNIQALRIQQAFNELRNALPLTVPLFKRFEFKEMAAVEVLTNRFSKLQYMIADKVFPLVLELLGEETKRLSFIDKLNKLEKLEIIPSTQLWNDFRSARNSIAHEYPEDPDFTVDQINKVTSHAKELIAFWERLKMLMHERFDA